MRFALGYFLTTEERKMRKMAVWVFLLALTAAESAVAVVTREHWVYQEVAELQKDYGSEKKLPDGKPCSKDELVEVFVSTLVKVVEKYEKEGAQGISRDDVESIRALIAALDSELWRNDVYRTLRRTIEQLLVLIEPPGLPF